MSEGVHDLGPARRAGGSLENAARGAAVVATGTPESVERLLGLGAISVVDWTAGFVADQVRAEHPDGVDALVNLAGFSPA